MDKDSTVFKLLKQSFIVLSLFIIVSLSYSLITGKDGSMRFSLADSQISFSDANGGTVHIPFTDILSAELLNDPDFGEPVSGTTMQDIRVGVWNSSTLGTYTAYANIRIPNALLIRTADDIYIINYESEETTAGICENLQKVIGK